MKKLLVMAFLLMCVVSIAGADTITGFGDVSVDSDSANVTLTGLTWQGTAYDASGLIFGTTSRYYIDPTSGAETLWVDGEEYPLGAKGGETVSGTSWAKVTDFGAKADNVNWVIDGVNDMSSIDGIDFQQTVFSQLSNVFFVFERGGNDSGTVQAILADGSLGAAVTLTSGASYTDTGFKATGQAVKGYVFQTDEMVQGLRITASGHDALTVCTVPEPATLGLIALGGVWGLRRRR